MASIGLFFGSFNPVHVGHMRVASLAFEQAKLAGLWFVLTPRGIGKEDMPLAPFEDRYALLEAALAEDSRFRVLDIEFKRGIPPYYTIDTLRSLSKEYDDQFSLLMGEDTMGTFSSWKGYEEISKRYPLLVYPRGGVRKPQIPPYARVLYIKGPFIGVSATEIRSRLGRGLSIRYMAPDSVWRLIGERNMYSGRDETA